jgi:hypothetical protein
VVSVEATLFAVRKETVLFERWSNDESTQGALGLASAEDVIWLLTIDSWIADDAVRNQAIPDEEDRNGTERRGDESSTLIGSIPADGLTDPS